MNAKSNHQWWHNEQTHKNWIQGMEYWNGNTVKISQNPFFPLTSLEECNTGRWGSLCIKHGTDWFDLRCTFSIYLTFCMNISKLLNSKSCFNTACPLLVTSIPLQVLMQVLVLGSEKKTLMYIVVNTNINQLNTFMIFLTSLWCWRFF